MNYYDFCKVLEENDQESQNPTTMRPAHGLTGAKIATMQNRKDLGAMGFDALQDIYVALKQMTMPVEQGGNPAKFKSIIAILAREIGDNTLMAKANKVISQY